MFKFKELVGKEVVLTVGGKEYRGTLWNNAVFPTYHIINSGGDTVIKFHGYDVFDMTKGGKA